VAVFDVTDRNSFLQLESSIKDYKKNCPESATNNIVICGNKADLKEQQAVSSDEG